MLQKERILGAKIYNRVIKTVETSHKIPLRTTILLMIFENEHLSKPKLVGILTQNMELSESVIKNLKRNYLDKLERDGYIIFQNNEYSLAKKGSKLFEGLKDVNSISKQIGNAITSCQETIHTLEEFLKSLRIDQ